MPSPRSVWYRPKKTDTPTKPPPMRRRHFLITYDVADDKRRTKLFNLLQGEGDHAQ